MVHGKRAQMLWHSGEWSRFEVGKSGLDICSNLASFNHSNPGIPLLSREEAHIWVESCGGEERRCLVDSELPLPYSLPVNSRRLWVSLTGKSVSLLWELIGDAVPCQEVTMTLICEHSTSLLFLWEQCSNCKEVRTPGLGFQVSPWVLDIAPNALWILSHLRSTANLWLEMFTILFSKMVTVLISSSGDSLTRW